MQRDEVLAILAQHRQALKDFGVRSLAMFGSVARDEANPDSDVDILVEFEGPVTFDRYIDVRFYLEDRLGTRVDLASRRALKPLIRPTVEWEAIYVSQYPPLPGRHSRLRC
ncbi:MAG: nucleotidyltransferase family protein [Oscillatoria princeps RMCB-10]|jgi:predicted nucleotidyltransferase|nr:nucleotidyltransferase family protein [Oscillatoria princeps RMCB-10]